ncbi:DUF6174 domain-containing protein [Actinoplanes sp. RD1]|uniref:DUF6174 domain-containing protein n=1 Tax=Actinoplanes sp. RD1 TaxID=3064538 RepID=UPI002741C9FB|nr:DUF6174 domain-containing protein [Actinoplanes sp. RD1]
MTSRSLPARAGAIAGGAVLLALAAGCTSKDAEPEPQPGPSAAALPSTAAGSPPAWREPADYAYTVERRCDGKPSLGTYEVTVAGGEVADVRRTGGQATTGEEEIDPPTLGGLLELARTAADDGGQMAVSSDASDGHPVLISFDVSESGTNDDNTCFRILAYTPTR